MLHSIHLSALGPTMGGGGGGGNVACRFYEMAMSLVTIFDVDYKKVSCHSCFVKFSHSHLEGNQCVDWSDLFSVYKWHNVRITKVTQVMCRAL